MTTNMSFGHINNIPIQLDYRSVYFIFSKNVLLKVCLNNITNQQRASENNDFIIYSAQASTIIQYFRRINGLLYFLLQSITLFYKVSGSS